MNSSLAAILASPVSGVSGAVTGYPIGRGDGVSTVFAAPPEITAISALYRRDWQGTVALSASARTNLFHYSQDVSAAYWSRTSVSYAIDAIAAPDGTTTADLLVPTTTSGSHNIYKSALTVGTAYTLSVFAKAGGYRYLALSNAGAEVYTAIFDLQTGMVTFQGVSIVSVRMIPLGNGWYRCAITFVAAYVEACFYLPATSTAISSFAGDGNRGIYLWGMDVKASSALTSYVPTTSAPVTVTDYTASGTTLTLAEVPARAAELTVDGTGVNLPLLQIGG